MLQRKGIGLFSTGPAQSLPFLHEGGINAQHEITQPVDDVLQRFRHKVFRHCLDERAIDIRQIAQQSALNASQLVVHDELREVHGLADHVGHNGFWLNADFTKPRRVLRERLKGLIQHVSVGAGQLHFVDDRHALVIGHAL